MSKIYHVAKLNKSASDENPGTEDKPFISISHAAFIAMPGDVVIVHDGVYRERVAPRRGGSADSPITYRANPGDNVMIKGSELWHPRWEASGFCEHVYFAEFDEALFKVDQRQAPDWGKTFPKSFNPYRRKLSSAPADKGEITDIYGNIQSTGEENESSLGQLFVNGIQLRQVNNRESLISVPDSWLNCPMKNGVYVNFKGGKIPGRKDVVELSVRSRCFAPYRRGLGFIHVCGFTMEHSTGDFHRGFYHKDGSPQSGLLSTRSGHDWKIMNNKIRFGQCLGIDCGTEGVNDADCLGQPEPGKAGNHHICFNMITDCGAGAIHGHSSPNTIIENNVLERNNKHGFTAPEIGAIKMHFFTNGVIRRNLIRDNDCFGIWLDNVWTGSRVSHNVIVANQGAGIFIEMGDGPLLIDNNVVALNKGSSCTSGNGDGIYSHDSSGVTLAHNLVWFNSGYGVYAHKATERRAKVFKGNNWNGRFRKCRCSKWKIVKNIIAGNSLGQLALPPESPDSRSNISDWNLLAGSYDRLGNETFAASLDKPLFSLLNNKGGIRLSESLPHLHDRYEHIPLITIDEWRALAGYDKHSIYAKLMRPNLSSQDLFLSFIISEDLNVEGGFVEGLDTDMNNLEIKKKSKAGPFQSLKSDPRINEYAASGKLRRIDSKYRNEFYLQ